MAGSLTHFTSRVCCQVLNLLPARDLCRLAATCTLLRDLVCEGGLAKQIW